MADETKPDEGAGRASGAAAARRCRARRQARGAASAGGADSRSRGQDHLAGVGRRAPPRRSRRPLRQRPATRDADDTSPLLNRRAWMGAGVGRLLGRVGRGARRDRPLHVSERAQRAAAAVQGRLPERIRHGRRRALEREVRHLDRAHRRRERRAARQRLLRALHHLHAPRLHAELSARRRTSSSARATAAATAPPASTSRARRRGRSSARKIGLADDGQILVDKSRKFQYSWGSGPIPMRFSRPDLGWQEE